jgi:hypothetical protein
MPITIQEIIASDTISQLVDKTNFNFDQLLLNGGGPAGPAGPIGPVGPSGGRGPKGTTWYEDTSTTAPGLSPIVAPPTATPLEGDYYLQFNGQVWEYTGLTWSITTIDLQGPVGPAGQSGGFGLEFGGAGTSNPITIQTARYNGTIGFGNGADTTNEGVPSIMIGGAVSNTPNVDASIPLTTSYIIPNSIATTLNSPQASLLIHQRDASARGIIFHGGYTVGNPEKFEQVDINVLSSVAISNDDRLVLSATKFATSPTTLDNMIGFEVNVPRRSHQYTAGKAIAFQTGIENTTSFASENSDFLINVGTGSSAVGNKFVLTTAGTANTTLLQAGGGFPVNMAQNAQIGVIQLQAGLINLTSSVNQNIQLNSGGQLKLDTTQGSSAAGQIQLRSATGGILATSNNGNITIQQSKTTGATSDIIIENLSTVPNTTNGGDIYIRGNSQIILRKETASATAESSIVIDYGHHESSDPTKPLLPHTRFVGHSTWAKRGLSSGILPPNAATYYYNELDNALTTSASTFVRTGSSSLIDMAPGATMHQWMGGTQTTSGVAAEMIRVGLGNELIAGLNYPVPAGGSPSGAVNDNDAYDNSIGLQARSFNNYLEYFSVSQNKTAIGGRLVHKRSNDLNSGFNSDPAYTYVGGPPTTGPYQWGWNTRYVVPVRTLSNFDETTNLAIGMPTTADLNVPVIFLNFGYNLGFDDPTQTVPTGDPYSQTGFFGSFNFPVGAYPGQRITVIIKNQASQWTVTDTRPSPPLVRTQKYYGTVRVLFPKFRIKAPSTAGAYNSWYQPGIFFIQDGCHVVDTVTVATDAQYGETLVTVVECIWDGTTSINKGQTLTTPPADPNNTDINTQSQWGWNIISQTTKTQGQVSYVA